MGKKDLETATKDIEIATDEVSNATEEIMDVKADEASLVTKNSSDEKALTGPVLLTARVENEIEVTRKELEIAEEELKTAEYVAGKAILDEMDKDDNGFLAGGELSLFADKIKKMLGANANAQYHRLFKKVDKNADG